MIRVFTICYIEHKGKTLMLHRIKKENDVHHGKWIGVGGKVESGESPEECIIREVKEETSLTIENPKLRGILTFPNFVEGEDRLVFLYSVKEFKGEIHSCDEGELHWIDNNKILDLNLWPGDRLFLEWLKKYKMFSGKLIYEKGELMDYSLIVHQK
ncbi:NUDIX domain-containing protein [Clostridium sp.]|uniref:NUDIX hydrolase n=1 Tax=Clostridium sp. TaxID=1506 RepID=UPI003464A971